MIDDEEALWKVRRWASFYARGVLCDDEMVNAFLTTVLESPFSVVDQCVAALPTAVWPLTLEALLAFADRQYADNGHAYINDGMTLEERCRHHQQMRSHYQAVCERLKTLLGAEITP
jgi:hypothetical protein